MSRTLRAVLLLGGLVYAAHLFLHDPEGGGFLPCPFRTLTGLLCPGCGSQRALHDLLHGRLGEALGHNGLLVMSVPLLGVQWGWSRWMSPERPLHTRNAVVYGWALLCVGFGIGRNLV